MTKTYLDAQCPILNQKGRLFGYTWNFYGKLECPTIVDFGSDTDELAYFRVKSAATSGDLEAVRGRVESDAETGTTMNVNALHGDAVVNASAFAVVVRGIYTDAMVKASATCTSVRGGDFNTSIYDGATITNCEGLRISVGHPTAAVTISGVDTILNLVLDGSNNHAMASAINLSCSHGTSVTVGIDFGDSNAVTAIDIGDVTYGIVFTGTATKGIDFADETTTAIDIGTCTTGISMTGTMTTGIDFASGTYGIAIDLTDIKVNGSDDDLSLIRVGGYDTANTITTALTANTFMVSINVDNQVNSTGAQWLASLYAKVEVTTADATDLSAVSVMVRGDIGKPMTAFYGVQSHVRFSGTGDCSSEVIALSAQIYGTGAGTGWHWGVKSDLRHTGCPSGAGHTSACFFGVATVSISCGLYLEALSAKTMYSAIYIHAAGAVTNAIELSGVANITYFLIGDAEDGGCVEDTNGTYSTADGYLKIKLGSNDFRIPYFAAVDD